ncbi:conserved hypothetical protein [Paecilomyces variotii No. 5]|uniref:Uncharacterized protein n=1 Tax=Byssochlamys spectabilis (strain No. 5 / NBRC 109023) TaxID=1356009 RepID=V5FFB6_BYSSN|nr:conserved hypothetical protein [Paecilomyces variotii No. 5]
MQNQPVELLQAEVDEDDQSFFRLLVNGKAIKYLTVDPGLYAVEDICFVAKSTTDGIPYFARAVRTQFPSVRNQWHKTRVDYLDLLIGNKLRTGIYDVKCPQFDTVVIAKFARFEWEIQYLENETTAYQWIDGHQIGPQFLGYLTEDGRVIGFLMERMSNARHAGPSDLAASQQTVQLSCSPVERYDNRL